MVLEGWERDGCNSTQFCAYMVDVDDSSVLSSNENNMKSYWEDTIRDFQTHVHLSPAQSSSVYGQVIIDGTCVYHISLVVLAVSWLILRMFAISMGISSHASHEEDCVR